MLKKNINLTGRIVRAFIGLVLLIYGIWQMSWLAIAGALFTFFEAYMSWCILYQFLGINRCPLQKNKDSQKTKNSKK
jgi:hypothetical protein